MRVGVTRKFRNAEDSNEDDSLLLLSAVSRKRQRRDSTAASDPKPAALVDGVVGTSKSLNKPKQEQKDDPNRKV
jgi:hypothetical protein